MSRALLDLGASPNSPHFKGAPPLRLACERNAPLLVALLLSRGASPTARGADGWSALHIAVIDGRTHVAHQLLLAGASPFERGARGWNPLQVAVVMGRYGLVRLMLSEARPTAAVLVEGVEQGEGGERDARSDSFGRNMARNGRGITSESLPSGQELPLNGQGMPMFGSSEDVSRAAFSLSGDASPPRNRRERRNAVIAVPSNDHNDHQSDGHQSSHQSSHNSDDHQWNLHGHQREDINSPTESGLTAVHVACHGGQVISLQLLLRHGAAMEALDGKGHTPLYHAAARGHVNCIRVRKVYKSVEYV